MAKIDHKKESQYLQVLRKGPQLETLLKKGFPDQPLKIGDKSTKPNPRWIGSAQKQYDIQVKKVKKVEKEKERETQHQRDPSV